MINFDDEPTAEYLRCEEPTLPLWPGMAKLDESRDAQREWLGRADEGTVMM
jgi:hypothetical protein